MITRLLMLFYTSQIFFSFSQYNNHWAIAKLAPQTHPKPPNISSSQLSNIHHKVVQKIHLPSVIWAPCLFTGREVDTYTILFFSCVCARMCMHVCAHTVYMCMQVCLPMWVHMWKLEAVFRMSSSTPLHCISVSQLLLRNLAISPP